MILDVQPDLHDYINRHIPGAVYMNEGLLRCPERGTPAYIMFRRRRSGRRYAEWACGPTCP